VADLDWKIAGTGDFNGDGKIDILWRCYGSSGFDYVWYMDGVTYTGAAMLPSVTDLNWQIAGTGDFNGDGNVDILWRYYGSGGYNCVWFMSGGIIPADRRIDWSRAGVWENGVKGIPDRTVVFCNVRVSIPGSTLVARGDGIQDDTAALQAAINACPTGQLVYIPPGTYRISGTLDVTRGIVVRGAGPASTRIIQYANSDVFSIYGSAASGILTDVLSGYSKWSDTVVVANAANFAVGALVLIDQLNDPSLVTQVGHEGPCNWCGRENGNRSMGEILLITERNGNTIKFNRPLYYNYQSAYVPQLSRMTTNTLTHAGVENLYIESASTGIDGNGFSMYWCAYCWLMNVESNNIPRKNVEIKWAACGNEVRDSYFHNATRFDADRGYGVNINYHSTDNLIENNIFYYLHAPVEIGSGGGAGNVIGYNYIERSQHGSSTWFIQHMGTHGAHTYMNLFEGNICGKIGLDSTWGSGSHNVFFRNHITGVNTGTLVTQALTAVELMSLNYYITFVGNVLGQPGYAGVVEQIPYTNVDNNPVLWRIGYWGANIGYPTDLKVAQTLLKTGNWESPTDTVQWTTSERAIPDSLYLTSKPAWFGNLAWPPFTPERLDFNPNNFNKIPAQVRFGR
jgi:hypothetical protein